jgi:hypothetical protein
MRESATLVASCAERSEAAASLGCGKEGWFSGPLSLLFWLVRLRGRVK